MSDEYTAAPLDLQELDLLFPLARALDRRLDSERWRAFARAIAAAGEREPVGAVGIAAIRSARGYFVGLFVHEVTPNLRHGPVLRVEPVFLVDALLHADAGPALAASVRDLARRHACRAIQVTRPEGVPAALTATALGAVLGPVSQTERLTRLSWRLDADREGSEGSASAVDAGQGRSPSAG